MAPIMKRLKTLVFTCILISSPLFAATQTAADQLAQLLNRFMTMKANFSEETLDNHGRDVADSNGTVMIARPGKFRWETHNPTHQVVMTNGKTLWIYDVDLKQATEQPVSQSAMSPARLLSGDAKNTLTQFDITIDVKPSMTTFHLTPIKNDMPFRDVVMRFVQQQLRVIQVQTNLSQMNVFTFSNMQRNVSLPDSLFNFVPPKGVEVLQ